jgi:hypothetical protein
MSMRRRIEPHDEFCRTVETMSAPSQRVVNAVLEAIVARPEAALRRKTGDVRVVYTRPYGEYPALSLYYRFDDKKVYLLLVEPYDPLDHEDYAAAAA